MRALAPPGGCRGVGTGSPEVQHAMLEAKMGQDGLKMALKAFKTCLGSG